MNEVGKGRISLVLLKKETFGIIHFRPLQAQGVLELSCKVWLLRLDLVLSLLEN